jgi:hypothetical protein
MQKRQAVTSPDKGSKRSSPNRRSSQQTEGDGHEMVITKGEPQIHVRHHSVSEPSRRVSASGPSVRFQAAPVKAVVFDDVSDLLGEDDPDLQPTKTAEPKATQPEGPVAPAHAPESMSPARPHVGPADSDPPHSKASAQEASASPSHAE